MKIYVASRENISAQQRRKVLAKLALLLYCSRLENVNFQTTELLLVSADQVYKRD